MSSKKSKSRIVIKPSHKKSEGSTGEKHSKDSTAYYSINRNQSLKRLSSLVEQNKKDQKSLRKSEEKIHLFYDQLSCISQSTSSVVGIEFLNNLVQSLASVFGIRYAFVGKVGCESEKTVRVIALWDGNKVIANFIYSLKGTPCEQVLANKICFYPKEVQKLFPKDQFLVDWGVHSYLGVPLISSDKKLIGLLSLMNDKPLVDYDHLNSILTIFAARCTSEIERMDVVSQLKAKTRELEKSNLAMKDFVSIASHDLQEPLRKIVTFGSRLMEKDHDLKRESKQYIEIMQKTSVRMQNLLEDLLLYSKANTQTEPFRKVNLEKVLKEVITDLELLLEKNAGTILVGSLPTIEGCSFQIRQLFHNLLSNAVKYHEAEKPPRIEVSSCLHKHGGWEISVKDQGIGFDEIHKDRIFRPFERLHGRDKYEGTGMGLAICQKIAENHGGTISVASQPKQGSCFSIIFPANHSL